MVAVRLLLIAPVHLESAPAATPVSQRTILIVDDSPENLMVLGELLHARYRVRAANSGERALQLACQTPVPDLVLLDVMMPGMNGYQVLEALRRNPLTRDVPVIFTTAMSATEDEEHGLALGAVDYTSPSRCARPSCWRACTPTSSSSVRASGCRRRTTASSRRWPRACARTRPSRT
jgi:CheY-like chemotaxis protein